MDKESIKEFLRKFGLTRDVFDATSVRHALSKLYSNNPKHIHFPDNETIVFVTPYNECYSYKASGEIIDFVKSNIEEIKGKVRVDDKNNLFVNTVEYYEDRFIIGKHLIYENRTK